MFYVFETEKGKLNVWISDMISLEQKKQGILGIATVQKYKGDHVKDYHRSIRADENGKQFFTWDRKRIYTEDFLAFSPEELVKKFEAKEFNLRDETLCHTLIKYGIDSLHVIINTSPLMRVNFGNFSVGFEVFSSFDEETIPVEYKFQEEYLKRPTDCYKLKLVPAKEEEYDLYPKKEYYVSDLVSLMAFNDDFQLVSNQ